MKQHYISKQFHGNSRYLIRQMNTIIEDYVAEGYRLTVRQLYYRLVAAALVENTERSYKRITGLVNDAKLAGMMDWDAIEDRTREFLRRSRWESGAQILQSVAGQYHQDLWQDQPRRVFVIVEKEALVGILERTCRKYDVPVLAARGYPSGTVLREFALADLLDCDQCQEPCVLHFGDHDPSGIDMSRDLRGRLALFCGDYRWETDEDRFKRVALNMDQIEELKPPPNPAKVTDSRFESYREKFGEQSWELDALSPEQLTALLTAEIEERIEDRPAWDAVTENIEDVKTRLLEVANDFE